MKSVKGGVFLKNLLDKLETSYRFYIISASSIIMSLLFLYFYLNASEYINNKIFIILWLMIIVITLIDTFFYNRKLEYALYHDAGTNLPNRKTLWKAIDAQLKEKDIKKSPNGLAVISIDNLHDISITFNHDIADELIATLWERIVDIFYPGAKAFHYHREGITVLFHNPEKNIDTLKRKLWEALEESIAYNNIPIHFVARVGYVKIESSSRGKRTLINEAESAMAFAREHDMQLAVFTDEMRKDKKEAIKILGSVRRAMLSGELSLFYQPKIDLNTEKTVGFEALARWNDEKLGTIAPIDFIPLVENTELIHTFTLWAINQSLHNLKLWREQGKEYTVAVNISSHNLSDDEFPKKVKELLKKYKLPPSCLELEVTESEIMKNPILAIKALEEIADIPLIISIDDFGTGYSSLSYLHKLPATIIKIDYGFTSQLDKDENMRKIVASTIKLGHDLGMKVVAEGVETQKEEDILKELHCDIGQGYLYSAAMPASDVLNWRNNETI